MVRAVSPRGEVLTPRARAWLCADTARVPSQPAHTPGLRGVM